MELFHRVKDLIERSDGAEGESASLIVIVREMSILFTLYYIAVGVLLILLTGNYIWSVCFLASAVMAGLLYRSYGHSINPVIMTFHTVILAMAFTQCFTVGIDLGFQNILYISLLLFLTNPHYGMGVKGILSAVSIPCVLGIAFFYHMATGHAGNTVSRYSSVILLVNEALLVAAIIIIGMVTAGMSRDTEHRLFLYNQKLRVAANTDPLTHLLNRRGVELALDDIVAHYKDAGDLLSVAMGDIDFFKNVNDTYGHEAGDAVLSEIGGILNDFMQSSGIAARWGGEEFLLLFTAANGDDAYVMLDGLRSRISKTEFRYKDNVIPVRMTFGLAEYGPGQDTGSVIKEADDKLYMGKQSGRNRVVF